MGESIATGAPAAELDGTAAPAADGPAQPEERAGKAGQVTALGRDASRLGALVAGVVAPATLLSALAYYFGWRRERAFAGYFGIDPSVLGLSTNDYVLRSVDALFVPFAAVLLTLFGALVFHSVLTPRLTRLHLEPFIAAAGIAGVGVGVALAAGHGLSPDYIYLQALAPGIGVVLIVYALTQSRNRTASADAAPPALRYVMLAVVLVSVFWATAEYADSRGASEARKLGAKLDVNPEVTIFSKVGLNINPDNYGGSSAPCIVFADRTAGSGYPYRYLGFTLLVRSGGKYFLTPTPSEKPWNPTADPVLVLPDDDNIRIELQTGSGYPERPVEKLASGAQPAFTC